MSTNTHGHGVEYVVVYRPFDKPAKYLYAYLHEGRLTGTLTSLRSRATVYQTREEAESARRIFGLDCFVEPVCPIPKGDEDVVIGQPDRFVVVIRQAASCAYLSESRHNGRRGCWCNVPSLATTYADFESAEEARQYWHNSLPPLTPSIETVPPEGWSHT